MEKLKKKKRILTIIQYVCFGLALICWFISTEIRDYRIKELENRVDKLEKLIP